MKMERDRILEIIGVCLIVTALVSAYGLYYTSREYARVTETRLNAAAFIIDLDVTMENHSSRIDIDTLVLNNVSKLDIEIYLIEYRIFASSEPINMINQRDYFGSVSNTGGANNIVAAGGFREYKSSMLISANSTLSPKLESIMNGGIGYFIVQGRVHYTISGPSELQDSIPFYYVNLVVANEG